MADNTIQDLKGRISAVEALEAKWSEDGTTYADQRVARAAVNRLLSGLESYVGSDTTYTKQYNDLQTKGYSLSYRDSLLALADAVVADNS